MKNVFKIGLISAFSISPFTESVYANPTQFDSLAVLAKFSPQQSRSIVNIAQPAYTAIQRKHGRKGQFYFTAQRPQNVHVTCTTVAHKITGQKLKQKDATRLRTLAQHYLGSYSGSLYTLQLFAHGYNASGREIHHHFTSTTEANKLLTGNAANNPFAAPGSKLTHAHVVARYGTNPTHGADGKPGKMPADVAKLRARLKSSTCCFDDIYANRGPFVAHVTLATLKSFKGTADSSKPQIDAGAVVDSYKSLMNSFVQWRNPQKQARRWQLFTARDFSLSGRVNGARIQQQTLAAWRATPVAKPARALNPKKKAPVAARPAARPAPAKAVLQPLPGGISLKHFWAQNPGVKQWALNPPKGKPRFKAGNKLSEHKYALYLIKNNQNIKCSPRNLSKNVNLKLFWLQNPSIRDWAIRNGKFIDGDAKGELAYAKKYYKWNPKAKWDPRNLPANFSLPAFWAKNPGIRAWALRNGKFSNGNVASEEKYARTFYRWDLKAKK